MSAERKIGSKDLEDTKSVQEVSKCGRGKSHVDYWAKAVYQPHYRSGEEQHTSSLFSVKIQHLRRRETFPLATSNRAEAARKAKSIWALLQACGWDETLRKFKPSATLAPRDFDTLGAYLDYLVSSGIYDAKALYRHTTKLFSVLRSMRNDGAPTRLHGRGKKLKSDEVHLRSIRLDFLTPARIETWKARYVAHRSESPLKRLNASHTLDAYIRACRAIFGARVRKRLASFGVELPCVPFASTDYVSKGQSAFRYRSRIDPVLLTQQACTELEGHRLEELKIFLLALHLGLRRNEIDKLTWSQFDFRSRTLVIETTQFAELKTQGSEDTLSLEPELAEFFERARGRSGSIFCISAPPIREPRPASKLRTWDHYRAARHFTALCEWLRAKGVQSQKPIHTLRKEFGRLITEKMGIYAASLGLRHSSTAVTQIYYADDRRPKHTGLGKLIALPPQSETPDVPSAS